jgi:PAS domain S-box-containing protein
MGLRLTAAQRELRHAFNQIREHAARQRDRLAGEREGAQALIEHLQRAKVCLLVADNRARYVDVNAAACVLTGYARDELLTKFVWDLTPTSGIAEGRRLWRAFLVEGHFEGTYILKNSEGQLVPVYSMAVANVLPGLHVSALVPGASRPLRARRRTERP